MSISIPPLSSLHPLGYEILVPDIGVCTHTGLASKRDELQTLQTAIPDCEARKAYSQLLLNEDIADMELLITNAAGDFIDSVGEDFEPKSVFVDMFGDVDCSLVPATITCETAVLDFNPFNDCAVCFGGVEKSSVLTNRWCKAEEVLSLALSGTMESLVPDVGSTFAAK